MDYAQQAQSADGIRSTQSVCAATALINLWLTAILPSGFRLVCSSRTELLEIGQEIDKTKEYLNIEKQDF